MNWYAFAEKSDIEARVLYSRLEEALRCGDPDWTWVRVKPKNLVNVRQGFATDDADGVWDGFKWVRAVVYESNGKVWVRLAQRGEFDD